MHRCDKMNRFAADPGSLVKTKTGVSMCGVIDPVVRVCDFSRCDINGPHGTQTVGNAWWYGQICPVVV